MARADALSLQKNKIEIYSDFLNSFDINPFTGHLAKTTNEDAVRQSLINIIRTNQGERFYNSQKGSRINKALFEPFDPVNMDLLRDSVIESCRWEPRAIIRQVRIGPLVQSDQNGYEVYNPMTNLDMNGFVVNIVFSVINIPDQTFELSVNITRVR